MKVEGNSVIVLYPCEGDLSGDDLTKKKPISFFKPSKLILKNHYNHQSVLDSSKEASTNRGCSLSTSSANALGQSNTKQFNHPAKKKIKMSMRPALYMRKDFDQLSDSDEEIEPNTIKVKVNTQRSQIAEESSDKSIDSDNDNDDNDFSCNANNKKSIDNSDEDIRMRKKKKQQKQINKKTMKKNRNKSKSKSKPKKTTNTIIRKVASNKINKQLTNKSNANLNKQITTIKPTNINIPKRIKDKESQCNCGCVIM